MDTHKRVTSKILSLSELASLAANMKSDGKKVILCHGTFDLLHAGHMRHFQRAKDFGGELIVTLTADKHVMKGPGRPVFPDVLRAEMVASQECVSFVGIVDEPSANQAIEMIQPDFYVKGADYRNASEDITGKIDKERQKVEQYGGELVFTDEITFSSSSILNRNFGMVDESFRDVADQYRDYGRLEYFTPFLDKISNLNVLLVGETIIDQYTYVDVLGKAAKESILACQHRDDEIFLGGVIAAANHIADFCKNVDVLTILGKRDGYSDSVRAGLPENVNLIEFEAENSPTIRKQRFIDRSYLRKMFEVYHMDDTPISGKLESRILEDLESRLKEYDLVIVTDFGHGLITQEIGGLLQEKSPYLAMNVQTNSGNRGFNLVTKYKNVNYLCIDEPEFRLACHDKFTAIEDLMVKKSKELLSFDRLVITHGRQGCYILSSDEELNNEERLKRIPALTTKVVDTIGAGDAFFAITSLFAAVGGKDYDLGIVGNIAGALKVNIVGHRASVEKLKFLKFLETIMK